MDTAAPAMFIPDFIIRIIIVDFTILWPIILYHIITRDPDSISVFTLGIVITDIRITAGFIILMEHILDMVTGPITEELTFIMAARLYTLVQV
ncbi:MAG: hypothetical protein ACFCU6_15760 [Balneolaceae bacterium]